MRVYKRLTEPRLHLSPHKHKKKSKTHFYKFEKAIKLKNKCYLDALLGAIQCFFKI